MESERVIWLDAGASFAVGTVRGILLEGCATCSKEGWIFFLEQVFQAAQEQIKKEEFLE